MTAIFLSHSSADNDAAAKMKVWLEQQGHTSLFLDFDPEAGIQAGGDWEQTLYRKLRQCQAVIALLTPHWLASKWCFAELVQAREKGKAIFPVKVQPCEAGGVFGDIQHIDLTKNTEEGYQRLALGLKERGLDPRDVYDWNPDRPPYPGLQAFQEADAAIFFGRGEEILKGLETLDALRHRGRDAARLALFLGASGSGKSSLVRAGVIPRLKKTPSEWLPVAPFRPQDDALAETALALAHEFKVVGQPRDWNEVRKILQSAAEQEPADGRALLTLARELCEAAEQRDATVVITIDQAEELFGYSPPEATTRFLRLLRAALETSDRQLMAMATLRSDFLGEFQTHRTLHDPAYDHEFAYQAVPVDPMPERNFAEIIRGPATLAGLRLEDGLVEAMVRDTGTRDALPLLAFTLRRLYERYANDGRLELHEYDQLGRLEGAIRFEAEQVLTDTAPTPADLDALRAAFVPTMVRINAEGGYARRRAYADEMPPRAKPLLTRFVDARLLVSDRDKDGRETLEVSHEALLRTWPQLTGWLTDDRDKLRLLENLNRAAMDWDNGGRQADLLVHRDGRLGDAEALLTNQRFAVQEQSLEKRYLDACIQAQHARNAAEREVQERELRDAERIAEEQKKKTQRTRIGLVVALLLAAFASWNMYEADRNAKLAETNEALAKHQENEARANESRALTALAEIAFNEHRFLDAVKLATAAWPRTHDEYRPRLQATIKVLGKALPFQQLAMPPLHHGGETGGAKSAANEMRILTWSDDSTARLWDAATGQPLLPPLRHESSVYGAAFNADETRILTWSSDGTARLWDAATGKDVLPPLRHESSVYGAVFNADESRILTWSSDDTARLWDAASGKEILPPLRHGYHVKGAAFNADETRILTWSRDGTTRLWDPATGDELLSLGDQDESEVKVNGAVFNADETRILAWFTDGSVRLWDITNRSALLSLRHNGGVLGAAFNHDETRILAWDSDGTARLWDTVSGEEILPPLRHESGVRGAVFGHSDTRILTWSNDGTARLWDATSGTEVLLLRHESGVEGATFNHDEARILTWSSDGTARLWDAASGTEVLLLRHESRVTSASFSADETRILTWSNNGTARLWDVTIGKSLVFPGQDVVLNDDGTVILTWADDNTVRVRDAMTGKAFRPPLRHESRVWGAALNKDETRIITWADDNTVRLWDATIGKEILSPLHHEHGVQSAAFSADETRIVTWSSARRFGKRLRLRTGQMRLWDAATGREVLTSVTGGRSVFNADETGILTWAGNNVLLWDAATSKEVLPALRHESTVRGAALNKDETRIITWADDNTVHLWDSSTGKEVPPPLRHESRVRGAALNKDESRIITWADDSTVRLWDATSGKEIFPPLRHEYVTAAAFYTGETRILSWSRGGGVRLWDAATGKALLQLTSAKFAFNGDESRILTWSSDGTARLWDAASGKEVLPPLRHKSRVWGAAFNHDETRILTWSDDNTARLWDAATGQPLLPPLRHESGVYGAAFNADETRVLTWSRKTLRLWDISRLPRMHLIDVACSLLPGHGTSALEDRYGLAIAEPICAEETPAPVWTTLED